MLVFKCVSGIMVKRFASKLSYIHRTSSQPLLGLTIGKILEQAAKKFPNTPAIISREQRKSLTFSELLTNADRLACALLKLGLQKGDRVGIWAPNLIEWEITMLACARTGLVLVQLNPAYQSQEIEYSINKVGVKCLVCVEKTEKMNFYEVLDRVDGGLSRAEGKRLDCASMKSLESVVMISENSLRGTYNYNEIIEDIQPHELTSVRDMQDKIDIDCELNIQFTSGSTALPKAALLSHHNVVNNSYQVAERLDFFNGPKRICVQVPFFHTFGTTAAIASSLHSGATLVIPHSLYNPLKSLQAIKEEKCNVIYGTPTMYVDLISMQKQHKLDLDKVETAAFGGAPATPKLINEIYSELNAENIGIFYGLTETTAMNFIANHDDKKEDICNMLGYVGRVLKHFECKVVGEDGNMVPFGTSGELYIRGYASMLGYYGDEEKTKLAIGNDRWMKTGDKFILHEDGRGQVVGRLKDLIIRGGENIYPKEIEDLLSLHPDILEIQVVGLPHERLGEEVCACVRMKNDAHLELEAVKKFCSGRLAHFKVPSKLVIMKDFPKTTSGKIQKFKIVNQLLEELKK